MCKYCNNKSDETIKGGEYEGNIYKIKGNRLNMDITVDIYDKYGNNIIDCEEMQDFIKINYCPFCGKKLVQ